MSVLGLYTNRHTCMHAYARVPILNERCLQEPPTYLLRDGIVYRIRIHPRLLAAATVVRNGRRVLRAEYAGSCARLKNGRGLVAQQLGDARGEEHARAVANGKHNYKFNDLYSALPWPPLALVGRF